ncbi:MAG TPA: hypothetical protein VJ787_14000, partial [Thermoleophilia bacterium]|nr:hypothetical protein [Thermoleophilia bacterium]
ATLRTMDVVADVSVVVGDQLRVAVAGGEGAISADEVANEILARLIAANVPVLGFEIEGSRLADVFRQLTQGQEVAR